MERGPSESTFPGLGAMQSILGRSMEEPLRSIWDIDFVMYI
jgi:hypothetical protein